MAQPRATFAWLSNPVLRDQGLFSRCLVAYPQSTAGTRMFRNEKADETRPHLAVDRMREEGVRRVQVIGLRSVPSRRAIDHPPGSEDQRHEEACKQPAAKGHSLGVRRRGGCE